MVKKLNVSVLNKMIWCVGASVKHNNAVAIESQQWT